ncbi:MAG: barstar family protein [Sideroxydans sp.]|nr:barstar family protein [Sideroxydans sp.]
MSDLCERLQDMKEAGVYRLTCPLEVLRGNVLLSEQRSFEIDLSKVHSKAEFLVAVAHAIQAPDWFGRNFDALADALCDLSWLGESDKGYVLLLLNCDETLGMTVADHAIVADIFNDVVSCWKTAGKPFWIFLA